MSTALQFVDHEPAVGINSKQVERTGGGLKLPADERKPRHEHVRLGDQRVLELALVVDLRDAVNWPNGAVAVLNPELDLIGHWLLRLGASLRRVTRAALRAIRRYFMCVLPDTSSSGVVAIAPPVGGSCRVATEGGSAANRQPTSLR